MKKTYGLLVGLLVLLAATSAYGADEVNKGFTFKDSGAGQKVEIPGKFIDDGVREVQLVDTNKPDVVRNRLPAEVSGENKTILSFFLPNDLPAGRYFVKIKLGDAEPLYVGELRVPTAEEAKVKVDTVEPVSYYPDPQNKYAFVIAGTNFASTLENNHVEVNKLPLTLVPCGAGNVKPCLKTQPGAETRVLIVEGYAPAGYSKPLQVGLRVGNGTNISEQVPVTFSQLSKTKLKLLAAAAFFALLLILYLLLRTGIKLKKIDGRFASLRAFLLDKETNSYSLSKFQLTLFTLVAVFGYIYIFVCRLAVQWSFELPPVPKNLPGMMAVSLGTTVVAAGVSANIGAKGAGPESPSFADFISSGGVVLPERFQFFLWTIVSSVGVLVLILASDPVTVQQLPDLPDGMLYLIGLSSAGYLGGKLVRGPGPSIKSIEAGKKLGADGKPLDPVVFEVSINGDNLSPDATFQLDDEHIPAAQVFISDRKLEGQDPKFCSLLKIELRNVAERYFDGQHVFRIINPDSQGADVKYGATIESITKSPEPGVLKVIVTGANFSDPSSARWTNAAGDATDIEEAKVTKKSDTQLEIILPPDLAGIGKLTIISPRELETTSPDFTIPVQTPAENAAAVSGEAAGEGEGAVEGAGVGAGEAQGGGESEGSVDGQEDEGEHPDT